MIDIYFENPFIFHRFPSRRPLSRRFWVIVRVSLREISLFQRRRALETRVSRIDEIQQWDHEILLGIVSIAVETQSFLDALPAVCEPIDVLLPIVVKGRPREAHNGLPLIRHRYLWSTDSRSRVSFTRIYRTCLDGVPRGNRISLTSMTVNHLFVNPK